MALPATGSGGHTLFTRLHGCPVGAPIIYYSNGSDWKKFLENPTIKNKNWTDLVEIVIREYETDEIRSGISWIWLFDMHHESIISKVLVDNLPNMTRYLMKRWENSLTGFYLVRPSTSIKIILKIIEAILPRERLINLHKINGGLLEINNKLEKMGRSVEERTTIHRLLG